MFDSPEEAQAWAQSAISDEDFNEQLDTAYDHLISHFKDKHESYIPSLFVHLRRGPGDPIETIVITMADFPDEPAEKQKLMQALGFKVAQDERGAPVSIQMITEAWMSQEEPPAGKRISDMDNKQEIIICIGLTIDHRVNEAMWHVKRDDVGNISLKSAFYHPHKPDEPNDSRPFLLEDFIKGWSAGKASQEL